MYGRFEAIGYKNGKKGIFTFTVKLYNGIANKIYDQMVKMGFTDISVHLK